MKKMAKISKAKKLKELVVTSVRIDYNWGREYDHGSSQVLFARESFGDGKPFSKSEIRKMIKEWFSEWTGEGVITINWIECYGQFYRNECEELLEWEEMFIGKRIKFKNYRTLQ